MSRVTIKEIWKIKKRLHVYYKGSVQGVGFRFTVERIANELKITGWVRNVPDGGVELIAEGEKDSLCVLLENIKESMYRYIIKDIVLWQEYKDEYSDFDIRF